MAVVNRSKHGEKVQRVIDTTNVNVDLKLIKFIVIHLRRRH